MKSQSCDLFLPQVASLHPSKLGPLLGRAEGSITQKVKVSRFVSYAQPKLTLPPVSDRIWPPEGLSGGSDSKESGCSAGDPGPVPGLGRFPWRREWQPTSVFLLGELHRQRSLAGCSPWGHRVRHRVTNTFTIFTAT